jgi:DNA-binding HxlR family transcriptional regulator
MVRPGPTRHHRPASSAPGPAGDLTAEATRALTAALDRVGDRWTLLVVAALLEGPRRFGELGQALQGVATNVLSARLRDLERQGLIRAVPYSERPLRVDYHLTAAGAELAGVLRLLAAWGASRSGGGPGEAADPPRHAACGTPLEVHWWCPTCGVAADTAEEEDRWV